MMCIGKSGTKKRGRRAMRSSILPAAGLRHRPDSRGQVHSQKSSLTLNLLHEEQHVMTSAEHWPADRYRRRQRQGRKGCGRDRCSVSHRRTSESILRGRISSKSDPPCFFIFLFCFAAFCVYKKAPRRSDEQASASIDSALEFIEASNKRIATLEARRKRSPRKAA